MVIEVLRKLVCWKVRRFAPEVKDPNRPKKSPLFSRLPIFHSSLLPFASSRYPSLVADIPFPHTALVLLGHGSTWHAGAAAPVFRHAETLRRRGAFAEVREALWKQEPQIQAVLASLTQPRAVVCPLMMSDGYFSGERIPQILGFLPPDAAGRRPPLKVEGREVFYAQPVGTHPAMTSVILERARRVVADHPFPRAPKPRDITLCLAGHGTAESAASRLAVEHQVELLRALELYGAVEAVFLEEAPLVAECRQLARTRNVVVVPFFASDASHVLEDIPLQLGLPEPVLRQRLAAGQPPWRNPTESRGALVWCSASVGTDPSLAEVILDRAREALAPEP